MGEKLEILNVKYINTYTSGNQTNTEYFYQFYYIIVIPVSSTKDCQLMVFGITVPNITITCIDLVWMY